MMSVICGNLRNLWTRFPFFTDYAHTSRKPAHLSKHESVPFVRPMVNVSISVNLWTIISCSLFPKATLINLTLTSVALGTSSFHYANTTLKQQ
jgi:hypothetical protein